MENKDFKYILQDLTKVYLGAKFTYEELMNHDEVPFKLKMIISHYLLKEVGPSTRVEDHIFYLKETDLSYFVFRQMKAVFRLNVWKDEQDGVKKPGYKSRLYKIDEIVNNEELKRKMDITIVEEMQVTKLGLMSVSI